MSERDGPDWVSRADLYERYSKSSAKAGDVGRQLALAGLAIVWLFGGGAVTAEGGLQLQTTGLVWVGLLLVVALGLDFAQYVYGALAWAVYARILELRDIAVVNRVPRQLNWPTLACFWGKLGATVAAYVVLAVYFINRL